MPVVHLVRVGALGGVGRFAAIDATRYPRASRVVTRTARGLELGEVLTALDRDDIADDATDSATSEVTSLIAGPLDGQIVRGVTVEDQLLEARLERNRHEAYAACARRVEELGLDATLVDVEHLFDGQTLVFYFLGDPPSALERYTAELAEAYEAQAQFRQFTATLTEGCGPECGTEAAGGCNSCGSGCAIAGACASTARH